MNSSRRTSQKSTGQHEQGQVPLLQAQSSLCFSPNSAEDCFWRRGLHLAAAAAVYILGTWSSTLLRQSHQTETRRDIVGDCPGPRWCYVGWVTRRTTDADGCSSYAWTRNKTAETSLSFFIDCVYG